MLDNVLHTADGGDIHFNLYVSEGLARAARLHKLHQVTVSRFFTDVESPGA